jgi:hypothetical protein
MFHSSAERLSLDGEWQIIFDDDNKGKLLEWQLPELFYKWYAVENIHVPSCWEESRQDYEGAGWYGKRFTIPDHWRNKHIRLQCNAVNYLSEIYVNGTPVGHHEGGYTGFEFEIADLLKFGEDNFLAVRVISPIITKDIVVDGLGRDEMPHWRGAIAGGIWQSVELTTSEIIRIQQVHVIPDMARERITAKLRLANNNLTSSQVTVVCRVVSATETNETLAQCEQELELAPGTEKAQVKLAIPQARSWSPEDPFLYRLEVELLRQGTAMDKVDVRFGMREFTVEGKHFVLNGRPYLLKAAFYEGLYPHTLAYPPSMDLVRRQFQLAKEAGFNMIRPWRRPQAEEIYDLADEMGLLLVGAIPVECMGYWPKVTPYMEGRIKNEVKQMILRDRNHPSIVIWEMFNEIMRYPLKRLKHDVSLLARKLDSSRIIIDESGGFAGGANFYMPDSSEPVPFNDVHSYPNSPLDQKGYDLILSLGKTPEQIAEMGLKPATIRSVMQPGLLTNITELGYGSIPMLEDIVARYETEGNPKTPDYRLHKMLFQSYKKVLHRTGVDRIYKSFADFCEECQEIHAIGNKLMLEAARINPDVAGIGVHALTDGDWVIGAGLLDIFGEPKRPYYTAQQIFANCYVAIRTNKANIYAGDLLQVMLTAVNDEAAFPARISVNIQSDQGETTARVAELSTNVEQGIQAWDAIDVDTSGWDGAYSIHVQVERDGRVIAVNSYSVYAVKEERARISGSRQVAVVEPASQLSDYLQGRGVSVVSFEPDLGTNIPVIVAAIPGEGGELFIRLQEWVGRGGKAIFLKMPSVPTQVTRTGIHVADLAAGPIFPFALKLTPVRGFWNPANHVIKEHPIFSGLPANCMMGQAYRNVYPLTGIIEPATDWIAGCIMYEWFRGSKHRMNYLGLTEAYDAAEILVVPHGYGKYVLSTLRLTENLGKDPIADTIVSNMIAWNG